MLLAVALVALVAGAVASIVGFGIGSMVTPLVGVQLDLRDAVVVVSVPHFVATVLRAWRLRRSIDREVLVRFGLASAAGGLGGALLHERLESPALAMVFGGLLVFAGAMGVTGLARRMRFGRRTAWIAGVLSGGFGGLVGNQGGIRSAALIGFDIRPEAFVATGTAVGVIVDLARMPVYVATSARTLESSWKLVAVATVAVVVGTLAGERVLRRIPEKTFRVVVSAVILALGVVIVARR